jgi:hypothetical protein
MWGYGTKYGTISDRMGKRTSRTRYEKGDLVKVEFPDDVTGISEWMWVRVNSCDYPSEIIFDVLDSEPINDVTGKLRLGTSLAIHFSKVLEHRKPSEF